MRGRFARTARKIQETGLKSTKDGQTVIVYPPNETETALLEAHQEIDMSSDATLVIGAPGKTGRRVAQRLAAAGHSFRPAHRSAAIPFDWEKPATWGAALNGMRSAYVAYQPDLAVPGALKTIGAFFEQALNSGVEKLVLLSGRGEAECLEAEARLQATRADWTILRASWFYQNFTEGFFSDAILAGEIALPSTLAAEPFVDAEDIAEIAVVALTTSRHSRQLYELTGPRAFSFGEAVAQIGQALGRDIAYIPVSIDDYRAELVRQQVRREDIEVVMYLFENVLDGRNTPVTDGVERALGRPARSFADFVTTAARSGAWRRS
jgi:uncharacterized protein YbjT (DUF2867 family)